MSSPMDTSGKRNTTEQPFVSSRAKRAAIRAAFVVPKSSYGRAGRAATSKPNARTKHKEATDQNGEPTARIDYKALREEAIKSASRVAPLVDLTQTRHNRSQRIRCTDYGRDRELRFPWHKFCAKCRFWDSLDKSTMGKHKRESIRNECELTHTNTLHPTILKDGVIAYDSDDDARSDRSITEGESYAKETTAVSFPAGLRGTSNQQSCTTTR